MANINPPITFRARPELHQRQAALVLPLTKAGGGATVAPSDVARLAWIAGVLALEAEGSGPGADPGIVRLLRRAREVLAGEAA